MKGKTANSSGLNDSTETGLVKKNTSILKDGDAAAKKIDAKTVRMADDGTKSVKSGDEGGAAPDDIWASKTMEEIENEMDKARERIDKI